MNNGLTKENILRVFPEVLQRSPSISALGDVVAGVLADTAEDTALCAVYPNVDELPEDVLDALAVDFGIDWWDYGFSLETKRSVFKAAVPVHKKRGTKGAVLDALSSIYPGTSISEWFEYNGAPYSFRLNIAVEEEAIGTELHLRVLDRVKTYKNARSTLDRITYVLLPSAPVPAYAGCGVSGYYMSFTATVEGGMGNGVE